MGFDCFGLQSCLLTVSLEAHESGQSLLVPWQNNLDLFIDYNSLGTGLLLEIKEAHELKRREDESILAFACGSRRPLIPDYTFELPEPAVHNDLYNIIKFAADETLSEEQSAKVMAFWTSFIEPFFGVNPRVLEDSLEVSGKSKGATLAIEAKPATVTADGKIVTTRNGEKAEKGPAEPEKKAGVPSAKPAAPMSPGKDQMAEPTLAGLAAGATHALAANADAAAATTAGEAPAPGPVSGSAAASDSPSEAPTAPAGPPEKPLIEGMEEDEKVKGGVSIEKGAPGHEETNRGSGEKEVAEKVVIPVEGLSADGNGVAADGARKEELEATPSGDDERADQAGAAGGQI